MSEPPAVAQEPAAHAQLPRGRHGLSRDEVARSQRARLLRAMAEAVSELGYAKTSVAEVLGRAGVSRESFYEHFANKEECFLASYDAAAATVLDAVARSGEEPAGPIGPVELLDGVLARYLAVLAREPAIARTFLIEIYAAGPAALVRRADVQARFVAAMATALGAASEQDVFACEALVAAVSALVTQRICRGHYDELEALHAPIMQLAGPMLDPNRNRP